MIDRLIAKLESITPDKLIAGRLRDGDCFCVLGYLADLSGMGHWEDNTYKYGDDDWTHFISTDILKEFNISYEEAEDLVELNDNNKYRLQPSKRLQDILARLKRIQHEKMEKAS